MSKFYNDFQGRARFDPTHDHRQWKQDIRSKAIRLILETAENTQFKALIGAKDKRQDMHEQLNMLILILSLRQKLEALCV